MNYQAVEQLLTQDARLLARRDAPVIDQETGELYTGHATEGKHSWKKLNLSIKDLTDNASV